MCDAAICHRTLHQCGGFFIEYDGIVWPERADTNGVVKWHQWFDAGTEGAVIFLAKIVGPKVSTLINQVLNNRYVAKIAGNHQRRNAVVVLPVHVQAHLYQDLDDLKPVTEGTILVKATYPAQTCSSSQGSFIVAGLDVGISAELQQQCDQFQIR